MLNQYVHAYQNMRRSINDQRYCQRAPFSNQLLMTLMRVLAGWKLKVIHGGSFLYGGRGKLEVKSL